MNDLGLGGGQWGQVCLLDRLGGSGRELRNLGGQGRAKDHSLMEAPQPCSQGAGCRQALVPLSHFSALLWPLPCPLAAYIAVAQEVDSVVLSSFASLPSGHRGTHLGS